MLSLLRKAKDYLWSSTEGEEVLPSPNWNELAPLLFDHDEPTRNMETRTFDGVVTDIKDEYGLVDGHIYFSFSSCIGNKRPRIGDSVCFTGYRKNDNEDWRVQKINIVYDENWEKRQVKEDDDKNFVHGVMEEDVEGREEKTAVGKVTCVEGQVVTMNGGQMKFSLQDVACSFTPISGDWLSFKVLEADDGEESSVCMQSVTALRHKTLDGIITSKWQSFGVVDHDIHFTDDVCQDGYVPKRFDEVRVTAIESNQGRYSWRAIDVMPRYAGKARIKGCRQLRESSIFYCQKSYVNELIQNKEGIVISEPVDFQVLKCGERSQRSVYIENCSKDFHTLLQIRFMSESDTLQFGVTEPRLTEDGTVDRPGGISLEPGKIFIVYFMCEGMMLGKTSELCIFIFKKFKIGRYVTVEVHDPSQDLLCSKVSQTLHKQKKVATVSSLDPSENWIIPGEKPFRPPKFVPRQLPQYPVPKYIWNTVLQDGDVLEMSPSLAEKLSPENYKTRMSALLHLEEVEMTLRMREFDMERVCFRHVGEYLALTVPGLAERRPSLLIGDKAIISSPWEDNCPQYEGYIHVVMSTEVFLKFHPEFHNNYGDEDYNVAFQFSRTSLRRLHLAAELGLKQLGKHVLFPSVLTLQMPQLNFVEEDIIDKEDGERESSSEGRQMGHIRKEKCREEFAEEEETLDGEIRRPGGGVTERIKKDHIEEYRRKGYLQGSPKEEEPDRTCLLNKNYFCIRDNVQIEEIKDKMKTLIEEHRNERVGIGKGNMDKKRNSGKGEENIMCNASISHCKSLESPTNAVSKTSFESAAFDDCQVFGSPPSSENESVLSGSESPDRRTGLSMNECHVSPPKISVVERLFGAKMNSEVPLSEANGHTVPCKVSSFAEQISSSLLKNNADLAHDKIGNTIHVTKLNYQNNLQDSMSSELPNDVTVEHEDFTNRNIHCLENIPILEEKVTNNKAPPLSSQKLVRNQSSLGFPEGSVPQLNPKSSRSDEKSEKILPERLTSENHVKKSLDASVLVWVNQSVNLKQKSAVRRILSGQCRPLPYIIYGPPGTGKTVTVVEAVLQIFRMISDSRILVATPSNSSADLITERLHESECLKVGDMVRLNAFQRSEDSIPESILPYCVTGDNLEVVVKHRVVIVTCVTAGTIYSLGLKHGHFTHVFVDEAGHATEPECLIPLGLITSAGGQIVLAGDPRQLGPVIQSCYAKTYGLELSFLERLSRLPLYGRDKHRFKDYGFYDPLLLTKLVNNYRSHPALLKLPSELFYDNELIASASEEERNELCNLEFLPKQGIPLIFHGVRGYNLQEGDSPSWFNPVEAFQIVRYLQFLLNAGIQAEDIGIITPYRKQVEKIYQLIDSFSLQSVKIGSVEEFQGQERLAILVSTVRSVEEQVAFDVAHSIGFLKNEKRFNVAITRAKALLIVVGNPHLLNEDQHWSRFFRYCVEIGAYRGCDIPHTVYNET